MRTAFAILGLCLTSLPGWAQQARRGVVKDEVAELRAGPSDKPDFYVTNRVRKGTALEVVGEVPGGWLKVRPPQGSYSWINTRFLQAVPPNPNSQVVALEGQEVPVYVGSEVVTDRRPTIEGAKLKRGHLVAFLREPIRDAEGTWARIEPPPSEVRFVRASALEGSTTGSFVPAAGASPSAPAKSAGPLPIASTPSANSAQSGEAVYRLAYTADIERRYAEAARLYAEASTGLARSNPPLASAASRRASDLENYLRTTAAGPATAASLHVPTSGKTAEPRLSPVGIYRGRIHRSGRSDGQIVYHMSVYVSRGLRQPGFYVVPGAGVNLPFWLDRDVEVHGIARGQGSSFYLEATLIKALH